MTSKAQRVRQLAVVLLAASIGSSGCTLFPAPRSAYLPIHQHAQDGDVALVTQDLARNPKDLDAPDDTALTPLHLAAIRCRPPVVELLIERGAALNRKADDGATPLHLAAQEGCIDVVVILVAKGSKVNARDDARRTPLKRSEEWDQDAVAEFLRAHGGTE